MAVGIPLDFGAFKRTFFGAWSAYPKDFMGLILLAWGIPALYTLANTFYLGRMEMEAIAISEQYENVAVVLEVLLEMFPLAVLALVARNLTDYSSVTKVVRSALLMQLVITLAFMALIMVGTDLFVEAVNTPDEIKERTVQFLRVKAMAIPFESIGLLFIVSIKAMRRGGLAVGIASVGVLVNFTLDSLMISNFDFSFRLGLMGSAWDYVISKVLVLLIAGYVFYHVARAKPDVRLDRKETEAILRIGKYTGMESAVRNAGYILGMLAVLNTLGTAEYGGYGVAMTIMWLIFLVPILALGDATNVAIGNEYGRRALDGMKRVQLVSVSLMGLYMGAAMIAGVFLWESLSSFFNDSSEIVYYSTETFRYLAIPYFFFALGTGFRSLFIGTGKTLYYLIPSAAVNLGIYIPLGLFVKSGAYVPSFESIMTISVFVFAADLLIVFALVIWVYRRLDIEMTGESEKGGITS